MKYRFIYKILTKEDIQQIENKISEVEKHTSGEIRLYIKNRRIFTQRKISLRELALKEFFRSGIDKTRDKTGVMIFILLSERVFEIVADSGINSKVNQTFWDSIVERMSAEFKNNNFRNGIIHCIEEVGKILKEEFPQKTDDINELPDSIVVEK